MPTRKKRVGDNALHENKLRGGLTFLALLAAALPVGPAHAAEPTPDQIEFFEAKVRPILVEHCYQCHSAEKGKSKGGLQLDSRDALRKGGATGPAFVDGDPEKSLLIEAVRYGSEDLQMPPKDEGGKLSAQQISALEQWIKMGAPDPRTAAPKPPALDMAAAKRHWAFQPVAKPAAPTVKNARWVRTPVDAFVLAKLEAAGLGPSRAADARTLLRRVTFDLTGLPPTPDEMDAFLRDRSPDAYEHAVERLLASPRYGERWGRFWLDVARYADTKGYLAGNEERRFGFSHTYRDYVIRAFNDDKPFDRFLVEQLAGDRLATADDKAPLAALGFLSLGRRFLGNENDIIDDRIDVTTRGLLGLTVTCARCHDHKFDPVPTADYYALHGVFASTEEPKELPLLAPLVETPAYREFLAKRAAIEERIKDREKSEVEKFLSEQRAKTGDYLLGAHEATAQPAGEKFELFAGTRKLNVEILKRWQAFLTDRRGKSDPVLAPWFALAELPTADFAARAAALVATWRDTPAAELPIDAALRAALATPPTSLAAVAQAYNRVFAEAEKGRPPADPETKTAAKTPASTAAGASGSATVTTVADGETLRRFLDTEGAPTRLGFEKTAEMIRRQLNDKVASLRRELEALNWTEPGAPLRAMALVDKATPHNSPILLRGNKAARGAEVPRQFLEVLAGPERKPFTDGSGRLELARAIATPENPLTARVFVNRVWGWHFGPALVRTPSDFGVRTEAPVQLDLLNWLAASFIEGGWSVKNLHRAIVLSNTYRQSSDLVAAAATVDPDNQLLHRANRRRLEFEALRDSLLAVAGRLNLAGGGRPDDLLAEPYTTRRTVYGFIDRQNLPGMFRVFDYPNPDASSPQRFATTVPQQALFMLNGPFVQEQARGLAAHTTAAGRSTDQERVQALYRTLFQRAPDREELADALAFLRAPVTPPPPPPPGGWEYGFGRYDSATRRVRDFSPMTHRAEGRLTVTEKFPDPELGRLSLTSTGGIPGRTAALASIRRWTAPAAGIVRLEGTLGHAGAKGDGVHGRVVSSVTGNLADWVVLRTKVETNFDAIAVQAGEVLDFVVSGREDAASDAYTWAPIIRLTPEGRSGVETWDAKRDFEIVKPAIVPLTRWEEFAQVLLLANEFAFVD